MTPIRRRISLGVCFLLCQSLSAICSTNFQNIPGFLENKGQIRDHLGNEKDDVLFMFEKDGFKLALGRNFFSYEFIQVLDDKDGCPEKSSSDEDEAERM